MQSLMTRYQAGDGEAFETLYRELAPPLRRHLLRLARDPSRVDDLVQETFLHIHRARRTYDPGLPLMPWAYAIARHVFLMDCRYRRRRAESLHVALEENDHGHEARHEERFDARRNLKAALSHLSPRTRRSVLLHHLHGLGFQEVAQRLRIADSAARARASRGIIHLRHLLGG